MTSFKVSEKDKLFFNSGTMEKEDDCAYLRAKVESAVENWQGTRLGVRGDLCYCGQSQRRKEAWGAVSLGPMEIQETGAVPRLEPTRGGSYHLLDRCKPGLSLSGASFSPKLKTKDLSLL